MKTELATIEQLNAKNLPELKGWKTKQNKLLKENPYVEITDNKSYEVAKKHRTALVKGRTSLTGQEKIIALKLKEFKNQVNEETFKLIEITMYAEEKQQQEVKRYEAIKDAEREEKRKAEVARISKIADKIEELYNIWHSKIRESTYETINSVMLKYEEEMAGRDRSEFDEFETRFEEKLISLQWLRDDHRQALINAEKQRLEGLRLQKEREKILAYRAKQKKDQEAEIEKRKKAQKKIDDANKKRQDELHKKEEELAEQKRLMEEKEELRLKKIADVKEAKAEAKRIKALAPDIEKLKDCIEGMDTFINHCDITLKTDSGKKFLDDIRLWLSDFKYDMLEKLKTI